MRKEPGPLIVATSSRALSLVVGSGALGAAYYAFLQYTPFEPDIIRVVPFVWLVGVIWGWTFAVMALRVDARKLGAVIALILNIPNTGLAAIFALAALMGD
jgi:hypothetical protein